MLKVPAVITVDIMLSAAVMTADIVLITAVIHSLYHAEIAPR